MSKRGKSDDEDHALWARVAETATPLGKRKQARVKPISLKPERSHHAPKPEAARPLVAPKPKASPLPHRAELDRQTTRRLEKGRVEVEAKLDLHGMRQRDAHAALRRFLKSAQGKDYRHVLVITGKGANQEAAKSFYERSGIRFHRGQLLASATPPRRRRRALCAAAEAVSYSAATK